VRPAVRGQRKSATAALPVSAITQAVEIAQLAESESTFIFGVASVMFGMVLVVRPNYIINDPWLRWCIQPTTPLKCATRQLNYRVLHHVAGSFLWLHPAPSGVTG
jgi:hypothetical protein